MAGVILIDPTKRGRTDQSLILRSIRDRLIEEIDEVSEETCWVSDQPVPVSMPAGRIAITVSMGPGRFPSEFFAGGGSDTLTEDGSIIVCILSVRADDRPRRAWRKIAGTESDTPSLLRLKRDVLAALLGSRDWEPHSGDKPLLRDMLSPLSATEPRDVPVGETVAGAVKVTFSTVFDWQLT